ncbi:hypothetical protein OIU35_10915 [Boseaceae bacterium BT-24-1]|nr:hypothetical protein [Boseaceae bacterium BT-24-1]
MTDMQKEQAEASRDFSLAPPEPISPNLPAPLRLGAISRLSRAVGIAFRWARRALRLRLRYEAMLAMAAYSATRAAIARWWRGQPRLTGFPLLPTASVRAEGLRERLRLADNIAEPAKRQAYLRRQLLDRLDRLIGLDMPGAGESLPLVLFGRPLLLVLALVALLAFAYVLSQAGLYVPSAGEPSMNTQQFKKS